MNFIDVKDLTSKIYITIYSELFYDTYIQVKKYPNQKYIYLNSNKLQNIKLFSKIVN